MRIYVTDSRIKMTKISSEAIIFLIIPENLKTPGLGNAFKSLWIQ